MLAVSISFCNLDLLGFHVFEIRFGHIQLFRERLSEKMCTRQSRKVIWDMCNTLFLTLKLSNLLLLLSFSTHRHMSVASRAILSNFFEKQWTQNYPQYLSGLSRAVHPTTFLKIAAYLRGQYFQPFFPFVCNIFLVYSLLWFYLLSMLSLLLFLQPLPGFQSYKPGI